MHAKKKKEMSNSKRGFLGMLGLALFTLALAIPGDMWLLTLLLSGLAGWVLGTAIFEGREKT